MSQSAAPDRARGRLPGGWRGLPVLQLLPRLRVYVLAVTVAWPAAVAAAAWLTRWRAGDALMCAALLGFGLVTVEVFRGVGEPAGSVKDVHGVWELPLAILLPPFYALTVPLAVMSLTQWRVRRTLVYRRVFSAAAVGLSYGAASVVFHAVWHRAVPIPGSQAGLLAWGLLAAGCGALRWVINNALVLTAVRLDEPASKLGALLGGTESLYNDLVELCVGVLVAFAAAVGPVLLVFALPCGTLLQRSARHAQLLHESQTDAKTGLLSAAAWEREAAVQVTRAVRTRTPAAVAMVDIDHFKEVNDVYGHLAGDAVLASLGQVMRSLLRDYDLICRFGGEEFAILLPQTTAEEARQAAERLRDSVARVTVPAGQGSRGKQVRVTVSVGVAAMASTPRDLADLLAAADVALYEAKRAGRNTVCLTAENSLPA